MVINDGKDDNNNVNDCRQVIVPTIQCEDVSEKSCVKLPNAEETTIDVTACVPVVDKPKCDKVSSLVIRCM